MSDEMVMELYSKDISRIKLPPISDKVRQAMREKKESREEPPANPEHHTAAPKSHRSIPIKFIFAALLTFLVASIPIIVILTKNTLAPVVPEGSGITDISSDPGASDVEPPAPAVSANALDRIKEQQLNGVVFLSAKGAEELESLLLTYSDNSQVYEDESFIYNFDPAGNLLEVLNKTTGSDVNESAEGEIIRKKAEDLFKLYYPKKSIDEYNFEIIENKNTLPSWVVNYSYEKKDPINETIRMTFDSSGELLMLILISGENDYGNISKKQAAEIAIKELQSGKYDIPDFNYLDFNCLVEIKFENNQPFYIVSITNIYLEEDIQIIFEFQIDAQSGEIINIDY